MNGLGCEFYVKKCHRYDLCITGTTSESQRYYLYNETIMKFVCDKTNRSGIVDYFNKKGTVFKEMSCAAVSQFSPSLTVNNLLLTGNSPYYHSNAMTQDEPLWVIVGFKRGQMKVNKYSIVI